MSAMKASTLASTPACGIARARLRRASSRRTGGALRCAAAPAAAPAPAGTRAVQARARPGCRPAPAGAAAPPRPARRCAGAGSAAISARTGLPTASLARRRSCPGNRSGRGARIAPARGWSGPARGSVRAPAAACRSRRAAMPPGPGGEPAEAHHRARRARGAARARACAHRAQHAQRRAPAASAMPLPRTPLTAMVSSGMPCCGTRRVSMPPSAPSQTTGTPRARSACATARPGKMWPPVPPARIITGRACQCATRALMSARRGSTRASRRLAPRAGVATRPARQASACEAPAFGAGSPRSARPGARRDRVRSDTRSSRPIATQVISTLEPPEEISGRVRPLVGSRPRLTPIETKRLHADPQARCRRRQ